MRVPSGYSQTQTTRTIVEGQVKLADLQQKISNGQKFLQPSDDSNSFNHTVAVDHLLNTYDGYLKNIDRITPGLSLQESTLSSANDTMNRARDLMLQSMNTSVNAGDRQKMGQELSELVNQMASLANTRTADGGYLFAGTKTDTKPFELNAAKTAFVYNGNTATVALSINPNRTMISNIPGNDAFGTTTPADPALALNALKAATDYLNNPTGSLTDAQTIVGNMDKALASITLSTTGLGARMNALDAEKEIQSQFVVELRGQRSNIADLNYPDAISQLNQQQTVLQAAMQSFSKTQGLSLFNYL